MSDTSAVMLGWDIAVIRPREPLVGPDDPRLDPEPSSDEFDFLRSSAISLATTAVDAQHAGLASGLVSTARATGGAVGLAVLATTAAAVTAHSSASDSSERLVQGYSIAIMVTAIIAALLAVLAVAARAADTNSTEVEKTTQGDL